MKAMIFAAGVGSRLKPWTDSHPKALVELAGEPMLGRIIRKLKAIGVDEFVINVHHFADQIIRYLDEMRNFGVKIHISDESARLLDTGGGLRNAATYFMDYDGPFIIHNADIFTDVSIEEMCKYHILNGADSTLLVANRTTSRVFLFDKNMRLRGWLNQMTGELLPEKLNGAESFFRLAFGGVHIVSRKLFESLMEMEGEEPFSITPFYIQNADRLKIMGFQPTATYNWVDVGRPETLERARIIAEKMMS